MKKLLILFLLLSFTPITHAHNTLFTRGKGEPYAFTLIFAREDFSTSISDPPMRIYKIGAEILELPHRYFQGGIHFGRFVAETSDFNTLTPNRDAIGTFGGLRLKTVFLEKSWLAWGGDTVFSYHVTDENNETPYIAWHNTAIYSTIAIIPFNFITLYSAVGGNYLRGKLLTIDKNAFTWETKAHMLASIGVDFLTDPGGHVGLEFQLAENKIVSVYFQRRY